MKESTGIGGDVNVADIQDPLAISLSGSTESLLVEANEAKRELEGSRPFSADVSARLHHALLPERIVATLRMEGISATSRQTLAVMDAMRIQETPQKGEVEIHNALKADSLVADLVDRRVELSERIPREVNALLLAGLREDAGVFRQGEVELPGAPVQPPLAGDVPDLMRRLVEQFGAADGCDPILQACWLHAQFTQIHPFSDGNGRTGRLLQDYALIRSGYLPVGIPASRRDDYYRALAAADGGEWDRLVETVADLELAIIAKTQTIANEPAERAEWIRRLSTAAARQDRETRHKKYLLWRRCVEEIVEQFCQSAAEFDDASSVLGADAHQFHVADFATWEEICRRGFARKTWVFSLVFFASGRSFYKLIFFLRGHSSHPYDVFEPQDDLVGVYLTGVATQKSERPDFRAFSDPHIRLREILMVGSNIYTYLDTNSNEPWECRDDYTVGEAVRELFEDVFVRKGGVRF